MALPRGKAVVADEGADGARDDKRAFRRELEARLEHWQAEIDRLAAQGVGASAEADAACREEIARLRGRQQEARRRLQELDAARGDGWKELREGIENACDDLARAVTSVSERRG
jgi:chromosome segregation ATPase